MGERFRDTLAAANGWMLDPERPRIVSARGREQRLAASRVEAVYVIRAVLGAALGAMGAAEFETVRAMALPEFFRLLFGAVQGKGDALEGHALAQLLDVLIWELEWRDVDAEVARG